MNNIKFTITRLFIIAFLLSFATVFQTEAAPGDLDLTFGSSGKINISIYAPLPTRTRVQPDGKIVTAAGYEYLFEDSFIARHNANGEADSRFGTSVLQPGMTYFNLSLE